MKKFTITLVFAIFLCFISFNHVKAGPILDNFSKSMHDVHCEVHKVGSKLFNINRHSDKCNNQEKHDDQPQEHDQTTQIASTTVQATEKTKAADTSDDSGIVLSQERATVTEKEALIVTCTESVTGMIHWVGPAATVLGPETRPSTGPKDDGTALFFDNISKDDEGVYTCSNGLGSKKFYLKVNALPTVATVKPTTDEPKRIITAGSNCPAGYRADSEGTCREEIE